MELWRLDVDVATWRYGGLETRCRRSDMEVWRSGARCRRSDAETGMER